MTRAGSRRALAAVLVALAVVTAGAAAGLSLPARGDGEEPVAPVAGVGSFSLAAVGDHGTGQGAREVFAAMGRVGPDVVLSLGDLAYDEGPGVPQGFCRLVKDELNRGARKPVGHDYGATLPVAIVEGSHDEEELPQYLAPDCLPDRLGVTPSGLDDPGQAYWVDLPEREPLVRLVVLPSEGKGKYAPGTRRHGWLGDVIDGARTAGIPWVVAAQHENYLTAGEKPDEIGPDVFNLLVAKKVDLVLQAHDHTYQRSAQLGHGPGCPAVPAGRFERRCVTDDGTDATYEAGSGTVLLINGTGGRNNYDVSPADPEAPYFPVLMGGNTEDASGFSQITFSPASIDVRYEQADGEVPFTDEFWISRAEGS